MCGMWRLTVWLAAGGTKAPIQHTLVHDVQSISPTTWQMTPIRDSINVM